MELSIGIFTFDIARSKCQGHAYMSMTDISEQSRQFVLARHRDSDTS